MELEAVTVAGPVCVVLQTPSAVTYWYIMTYRNLIYMNIVSVGFHRDLINLMLLVKAKKY